VELKFDPENPKYEFITTEAEAEPIFKKLSKEKMVGVDIESTSLNPFDVTILTVQIGTADISYVFDSRKIDFSKYKPFKKLMEDSKVVKILQNAKFDYKMIKLNFGVKIVNIYDTMLAEGILNAGMGVSVALNAITQRRLDLTLKKDVRETFGNRHAPLTEEQIQYGAVDTLVLFPIFEQQWPLLQKEGLVKTAKLEFAVTSVVGDMELNGIYIDQKKWRTIIKDLGEKRKIHAQEFQDLIAPYYKVNQTDMFSDSGVADSINMNSQVQLMDLFNNRLNLGIPSTGVAILSNLNHPVAKKLMEYRGYEKLISAFGDSLLEKVNPKTKRLHPNFQQLRTATGRFACNNPNLQQIPAGNAEAPFRSCFNPPKGYKLVTTDYSSQEMRILAELSGDQNMLKGINDGLDMHSYTASVMFDKEYTADFKKKFPELRQVGKTIGFGLMYGMGAMGLANRLEITPELGEEYMKKYFSAFPDVRKFLDGMANNAVKKGWSSTIGGRKRWYIKPPKTDPDYRRRLGSIQRQAKNHPIQGTAADMIKFALVFIKERIDKEGIDAKVILTVHDEIVTEVKAEIADEWAEMQIEEMRRAGALFIKKLPVLSDSFVGDYWDH
jgi:DNA polymerase I